MDIERTLADAIAHHRSGDYARAEKLYRDVLSHQPNHVAALHLLGVVANQTGRPRESIEWIKKAIAVRPQAEFHFDLARALMPIGEFESAIVELQKAMQLKPNWAPPVATLGIALQTVGKLDDAIAMHRRAIELEPGNAQWHCNLAVALAGAKRNAEATEAFENCLRLDPKHLTALNHYGNLLYLAGKLPEAGQIFRRAMQINPRQPQTLLGLGRVCFGMGRMPEAEELFRRVIAVDPKIPVTYILLGKTLEHMGQLAKAVEPFGQAIALQPIWPEARKELSHALLSAGDINGAIEEARESLRQRPGYAAARENLADALHMKGETDQAIDLYAQLVAEEPDSDRFLNSYGNLLRGVARTHEAIECFHRAAEVCPEHVRAASNYLFALQFQCEDPKYLLQEHRKWDERYAQPLADQIRPFSNDRNPSRRLRVGFVSPDFRKNVLALLTNAVFPHHDHDQFEIFCYSGVQEPDAVTARLQQYADVWRPTAGMADQALADQIRADRIDILMDQTMHMRQSRLLVFARKPAPIQLCWLAYPGTTGLSVMDYRLTDPHLDPAEFDDRYSEKSVRLESFWVYEPRGMCDHLDDALPDPGELPAIKNGFITFGCLNDFSKLNRLTIERWGRLMQTVKHSRLHVLAPRTRYRDLVTEPLKSMGISPDRVEFIVHQPRPDYLAEYRRIDLGVDALPYNGHTTSLDSFWMGVPVLTQIGPTLVGRAGLSQLNSLQLEDFVARDDEQFVSLGKRWAEDIAGLAQVRRTLRQRMSASPIMDAQRFTRRMESEYRAMWTRWCSGKVG